MEAIHQGQAEKLWDLIAASIENGFISHLGLDRKEASKMRGRNAVRIRTNEGVTESKKIAVTLKKGSKLWMGRAIRKDG